MIFIFLIVLPVLVVAVMSYWLIFRKPQGKKSSYSNILDSDEEILALNKALPNDAKLQENNDVFELEDMVAAKHTLGIKEDGHFEKSKSALNDGDTVKLRFNIFVKNDFGELINTEVAVEDLWVLIERVNGEFFYGVLANELQEQNTKLKQGHKFWFHANHVFEID